MSKNFPLITKIIISFAIAIIAIFIPNVPLRILLALFSAILFIMPLKKHGIFFIIVVCIVSIVGISVNSISQYSDYFEFPIMARNPFGFMNYFFPLPGYKNNTGNLESGYNKLYAFLPEKTVESINNVNISGDFVRIEFDADTDDVKYPSQASSSVKNGILNISSNNSAKPFLIIIGTKSGTKNIDIVSEKADINGSFQVNSLNIISEEIFFNGKIICEEKLSMNSDLTLSGICELKSPEIFLKAELASVKLNVEKCENIIINCSVFSGSVKYLDKWDGTRTINFISSGFGDIDIFIPSETGTVEVLHNSGMINSHKYSY